MRHPKGWWTTPLFMTPRNRVKCSCMKAASYLRTLYRTSTMMRIYQLYYDTTRTHHLPSKYNKTISYYTTKPDWVHHTSSTTNYYWTTKWVQNDSKLFNEGRHDSATHGIRPKSTLSWSSTDDAKRLRHQFPKCRKTNVNTTIQDQNVMKQQAYDRKVSKLTPEAHEMP